MTLHGSQGLDPAGKLRGASIELCIGCPSFGPQNRRGPVPEGVAKRDQPEDGKPGHHVGNTWNRNDPPQQHRRQPADQPPGARALTLHLGLTDHDVGPTLDPADQIGDELRVVGEIRMHEDGRIPLGAVGALYCLPQGLFHAFGVSQAALVPGDRKREDASVAL